MRIHWFGTLYCACMWYCTTWVRSGVLETYTPHYRHHEYKGGYLSWFSSPLPWNYWFTLVVFLLPVIVTKIESFLYTCLTWLLLLMFLRIPSTYLWRYRYLLLIFVRLIFTSKWCWDLNSLMCLRRLHDENSLSQELASL